MLSGGAAVEAWLDSLVHDVADFPSPGVVFKDITPLLADAAAFAATVEAMADLGRDVSGGHVDAVVGVEARGFVFAAPVALALGTGFVPVRKQGKLPWRTLSESYALEYGEATVEIHEDAFTPGARVLVVDDVLATGGTAAATVRLVQRAGGAVVGIAVLLEVAFLNGRAQLAGLDLQVLLPG